MRISRIMTTFEEFISDVGYGCDAEIDLAKIAWDTAIEEAAKAVEAQSAEWAEAIRMLRSK